jgi:hypothetical protein
MIIDFEKEFGFALKNVEFVLNIWDNILIEYPNTNLIATRGYIGPFLTTTFKINKVSGQYFNEFENRFGSFENDIKSQIDFFKWSHKGYPSLSVPNDELIFNNEIPIFRHASYSIKDPFQGEIKIPWPEGTPIKIQEIEESIKNKKFRISPEVMAGLPYLIGRAKYAKKVFSKYNQTLSKDEINNTTISDINSIENKTKNKRINIIEDIEKLITQMDPSTWKKVFLTEEDYLKFKDILASFFIDVDFILTSEIIKIRKGSKTSIIGIFKPLHDKYSNFAGHMKDDKKYFNLVRILSEWQNNSDTQIDKRISSNSLK